MKYRTQSFMKNYNYFLNLEKKQIERFFFESFQWFNLNNRKLTTVQTISYKQQKKSLTQLIRNHFVYRKMERILLPEALIRGNPV